MSDYNFQKNPFKDILNQDNIATFIGTADTEIIKHHSSKNINYYTFNLKIKRLSDVYDTIPVMLNERCYNNIGENIHGKKVYCSGEVRSYNEQYYDNNNNLRYHVKVFIYAYDVTINVADNSDDMNHVHLSGYLCKDPIYRLTPNKKAITDLVIAVCRKNSTNKKVDYIPAIAWNTNAVSASNISKNDRISVTGRFQSREYTKNIGDKTMTRTSYEISISDLIIDCSLRDESTESRSDNQKEES